MAMRNEEERRGRRGTSRWEPAEDGEGRRWHGDEEGHGPRRGHAHFQGLFAGRGFPGPERHGLGPWPREFRGMRGPRARRGNVRAAALALLAEQPMNGYQIIQEIAERSGGVWRPSPGSIYPALQQLEDEGLITAQAGECGRRAYELTEDGRTYAAAHPDELTAPWDVVTGGAGGAAVQMRKLIGQGAMAAFQVVSSGTDAHAGHTTPRLPETVKA